MAGVQDEPPGGADGFGRQRDYINIFREKKPTDEQQAELARQADSHMSIEKLKAFIEALEKKENDQSSNDHPMP